MPTMITVPVGQRTKSIQFGAAYSPALSFNPDKKLLAGCSGVLSGMGVTVNTIPDPDQVTVAPGAFIQNGIIVNITSPQVVEVPTPTTFPLYLVAENANEVFNSSVQILFTTTPNADSVVIAEWPSGPITMPTEPQRMSLCALRDALSSVQSLVIQRERIVASFGQTVFTLPPQKAYQLGTNKLFVYRNGKKLEVNNDYSEDSPTQFTTNFPAALNDVFDVIVFQGAPSITGLSLLDLTDVTLDLANAIKDVSALRVSPANASNPLATLADIAAAISASGAEFAHAKFSSVAPDTNVAGGIDIPGTTVTFTLTATRRVLVHATSGGFYHSLTGSQGTAYIRIDGADYRIGHVFGSDGGDSLVETGQAVGWVVVTLVPGVHTAKVRGTGVGNPIMLGPIQLGVFTGEPI